MARGLLDTYNDYAWPNRDSYRGFGVDKVGVGPNGVPDYGRGPRRGCIVSVNRMTSGGGTNAAGEPSVAMEFDYALVKRFQFNPPNAVFDVQATAAAPGWSEITEGAGVSANDLVLGQAKTELKLLFNRELEVFRATNNHPQTPKEFRDFGVQLDVLDVIKVMLGAKQVADLAENAGSSGGGFNITAGTDTGVVATSRGGTLSSINQFHRHMFDSLLASTAITSAPIGIIFANDLAFFGNVGGLSYDFQKFTKNMIPTIASVTLTLVLTSGGTGSTVGSLLMPGATSSSTHGLGTGSTGMTQPATSGTARPSGGTGNTQYGLVAT